MQWIIILRSGLGVILVLIVYRLSSSHLFFGKYVKQSEYVKYEGIREKKQAQITVHSVNYVHKRKENCTTKRDNVQNKNKFMLKRVKANRTKATNYKQMERHSSAS